MSGQPDEEFTAAELFAARLANAAEDISHGFAVFRRAWDTAARVELAMKLREQGLHRARIKAAREYLRRQTGEQP